MLERLPRSSRPDNSDRRSLAALAAPIDPKGPEQLMGKKLQMVITRHRRAERALAAVAAQLVEVYEAFPESTGDIDTFASHLSVSIHPSTPISREDVHLILESRLNGWEIRTPRDPANNFVHASKEVQGEPIRIIVWCQEHTADTLQEGNRA